MEDDFVVEQTVVKTFLRCNTVVKEFIEEIVQLRSKVQSYSNALYTLVLLQTFNETGRIPKKMFDQAPINAAMRAVCSRKESTNPSVVVYKPCSIINARLVEAQTIVVAQMCSKKVPFEDDTGLTETFNQAARQFITVFRTNVVQHFKKWLQKALRTDVEQLTNYPHKGSKSAKGFINRFILSSVMKTELPDAGLYKAKKEIEILQTSFLCSDDFKTLIKLYDEAFSRAAHDTKMKHVLAYDLKAHTHVFIAMGLFCASRMERVYNETDAKRNRPLQVIPQLTMKTRHVTFGT